MIFPNLIGTPFNSLKGEINSTFAEVASTLNAAQLPLPAVRTVQLCNNVDTSIVDDIGGPLVRIAQTSVLGVVVVVPHVNAVVEWHRFRRFQGTYANSGRTTRLPLSDSPTRSFPHSMLSSSRPSARAQLASLTGFFRLQSQT